MAQQYIYTMVNLRKVVPPQREILKGIYLAFFPGAKIGVLGLNGAGKSSLLRIMAGVDREFNGEAFPAEGTRVGFLAQDPTLVARVPISPRAAEEIAVGPGTMRVEYSRPFAKGRKIFGGLVPWGKVWRTGANAATTLVADVDVTLGTVALPKGTYTLYTLPGEKEWLLIVNRQTGQWGTEYDPKLDFARIPMKAVPRADLLEAMTISFLPEDAFRGTLRLSWERKTLFVPYAYRK